MPTMSRRKHRRVRKTWGGCRCPTGSRRVSTCKKLPDGSQICRGRGWGCLGLGVSQKGKSAPRFLAALCDSPAEMAPSATKRRPGRPRKVVQDPVPAPQKAPRQPRRTRQTDMPMPKLSAREQSRMLPGVVRPPFLDMPGPKKASGPRQLRLPYMRKVS